jgi:hypothetical protein
MRWIVALLLLPGLALAQPIYRSIDARGNPVFSDQPPMDGSGERIDVSPINRIEAPTTTGPTLPVMLEQEPAVSYRLRISSPADDTTIPMGPGSFTVSAQVEPRLAEGHTLQLIINADLQLAPQRETTWQLEGVPRGEHDIAVVVLDKGGSAIAKSPTVRVNVLRPSRLYPNRQ